MLFKPLVVAYNILSTISMLDQNQRYDIYTYNVLSADCLPYTNLSDIAVISHKILGNCRAMRTENWPKSDIAESMWPKLGFSLQR